MNCLKCGNCKENTPTYYCLAKGEIVINENYKPDVKVRTGWKKGTKDYEMYRRKTKKEVEI
ncbi:hypothetical protein [Caldisalinibacter kiritimatiensis]|uniref:Uncharacterized protein n=1 Tax=Caldisalinibacter kiritimatiensis TaxID=1304284 RepID=R1CM77_9FIRM|nr:hypothetical protein [Caldisalinibacter kiritimatiensis]EOC99810.1 hypothetical protein L21TH_2115 [Caldisalinibacter kiritimatiensis]